MNRQDRRRQKNNSSLSLSNQNYLLEAIKLHTQKDYPAAEKIYKKLLVNNSKNYDVLRHLGILKQDIKNFEEAFKYYMKALKINPNGFEVLNNLGVIHQTNKNYRMALNCFNKSISLKPDYLPTINNLANYFHKKQLKKQALEYAERGISLQPNNLLAQNQYAKALVINGKMKDAINILENLCEARPDLDDFKINLASAYKEAGEFVKSKKIIDEGFNKNFREVGFFVSYASDKKNKLTQEQIEHYNTAIDKNDTNNEHKIAIAHSLFTYFKNKENFDTSGKYLIKANDLQYELNEFNIDQEQKYFENIKSTFSKNLEYSVKEKHIITPIFICGMPRSGTTLCEQILSTHSHVDGAGELSYLADLSLIEKYIAPDTNNWNDFINTLQDEEKLTHIRNTYLEQLSSHKTKSKTTHICDKMPHNFILIGLIKLIFPEAKIIYCKRDPIDNCFSLYSHKFIEMSHQYSYDQTILAEYYKMHEKLMNFWIKRFGDSIFVLDNETLVNKQEKLSREVIKFCSLEWEKECLNFYENKRQVRTASIEQVRQPMNNKSIGAWKKYENYLSKLVSGLR